MPAVAPIQRVMHDYSSTGLSLKAHPVSFVRADLDRKGVTPAAGLADGEALPHGRPVSTAGVVGGSPLAPVAAAAAALVLAGLWLLHRRRRDPGEAASAPPPWERLRRELDRAKSHRLAGEARDLYRSLLGTLRRAPREYARLHHQWIALAEREIAALAA